jgi:hypothetical protein
MSLAARLSSCRKAGHPGVRDLSPRLQPVGQRWTRKAKHKQQVPAVPPVPPHAKAWNAQDPIEPEECTNTAGPPNSLVLEKGNSAQVVPDQIHHCHERQHNE